MREGSRELGTLLRYSSRLTGADRSRTARRPSNSCNTTSDRASRSHHPVLYTVLAHQSYNSFPLLAPRQCVLPESRMVATLLPRRLSNQELSFAATDGLIVDQPCSSPTSLPDNLIVQEPLFLHQRACVTCDSATSLQSCYQATMILKRSFRLDSSSFFAMTLLNIICSE